MSRQRPTLDQRPSADAQSVADLITHAAAGQLRVPKFQRGFRWDKRDVLELFDSIWHGYPIGSFLLWERPAPESEVTFGSLVVQAPEQHAAHWVVDGQHRLTALAATLIAHPNQDARFELYFDLETESIVRRGQRGTPPVHWLELAAISDTNVLLERLGELRDAGVPAEQLSRAREFAKVVSEYKVPLSIVRTADEQVLRQIFHRVNTAGRRMTSAEVFRALHASAGQDDAGDLNTFVDDVGALGFGQPKRDVVLRCLLAVRGGDVYRNIANEFDANGENLAEAFDQALRAIERAVRFLRDDAYVQHVRALPYTGVLPILTRFFALHPEPEPRTLILLRRWLWRGSVAAWGRDVGALRQAVQAVDEDEQESIARLLVAVGRTPLPPVDLSAVQFNKAAARLNVALLTSLEPRDLETGEQIDVAALLEDAGPAGLLDVTGVSEVAPRGGSTTLLEEGGEMVPEEHYGAPGLADRILHPDTTSDVGPLIAHADEHVLRSLAIPPDAAASLVGGTANFAMLRYSFLQQTLTARLEVLAEPDADDRPSVKHMLDPEG